MARKKIAAIYARKSRENAITLEGQINSCVEWCNRNNVEYEIFAEQGSASSEDWTREELQRMMKAVKNFEFDLVVCTEQWRICRDDHFPIFKNLLKEMEMFFVTADNNSIFDFNNPDDELKSDILQAVGKNELARTKIRLIRGTVQAAKRGDYQGKKPPMGYDYDKNTKRLVKNSDAAVVREMFELYLQGYSTTEISYKFTQENKLAYHKIKGQKVPITWSKSTVARSLKNIVYAGHTLFGKTKIKVIEGKKEQIATDEEFHILIKDTHKDQAIVTNEEFEKVLSLFNKKRTQPPAMKHAKHIFSGLVACANCGKHHTFEQQKNDKEKAWRVSSCQTRVYNDDYTKYKMCGNSGCKLQLIENLFYASLEKTAKEIENYIDLIKEKRFSNTELKKVKEQQIKGKEQQIKDLTRKRKNILDNLEFDIYEEDEKPEKRKEIKQIALTINDIKSEIEEMQQIKEESDTAQVKRILNNIKRFLTGQNTNMSAKEQNEILHEFIQDIVYKKEGKHGEIKIKVFLKQEIKEMFNEIKKQAS